MGKGRNVAFFWPYRAAIQPEENSPHLASGAPASFGPTSCQCRGSAITWRSASRKPCSWSHCRCLFTVRWSSLSSSGDGFRVRSLAIRIERVDRPKDGVLDFRQLGVWTQAVDGRGLKLVLPTALRHSLAVEILVFVPQGPQLLVGEAVPLEMPDDLGERMPPFASRGECQICMGCGEVQAGTVKQLAVGRDLVVADVLRAIPRRSRQEPEQFAGEGGLFMVLHPGFLSKSGTPQAVTGVTAQGANPRFRIVCRHDWQPTVYGCGSFPVVFLNSPGFDSLSKCHLTIFRLEKSRFSGVAFGDGSVKLRPRSVNLRFRSVDLRPRSVNLRSDP